MSAIFCYDAIQGEEEFDYPGSRMGVSAWYSSRSWIRILLVSHHWREIAMDTAELWAVWGNPDLSLFPTFAARSKAAALHIRMTNILEDCVALWKKTFQRDASRQRIRELHLSTDERSYDHFFEPFDNPDDNHDTLNLRSLKIFCRGSFSEEESAHPNWARLPVAFSVCKFPVLNTLLLQNCAVDWESPMFDTSVLFRLQINQTRGSWPTMTRLLHILKKQPLLQELAL